ncbi:MAG: hypothetical protein AB7D38_05000 [Sulfurimonas sp.]|uniref:hypothetical protein n=1 Tax=Sulfurimonas sp. TaxID=2022749 RepID=UPI003D0D23F1
MEAMAYALSEAMACLRSSAVVKVRTFKRFLPKASHRFQKKIKIWKRWLAFAVLHGSCIGSK